MIETILFACVQNAGRSQLAMAWFNSLADPSKARAISAGTRPATSVHAGVVHALAEDGLETPSERPRLLTPEIARSASLVITMGCGESCPVIVGQDVEDWPVTDPEDRPLAEVRKISREIRARVEDLIERRRWSAPGRP